MIFKDNKILLCLAAVFVSAAFLSVLPAGKVWAVSYECIATINFDVTPKSAAFNQEIELKGTVDLSQSVLIPPGVADSGYCLKNEKTVIRLRVRMVGAGGSGEAILLTQDIALNPGDVGPFAFSKKIKPSDYGRKSGETIVFTASVAGYSDALWNLTTSSPVTVVLAAGVYGTYGCVASDGILACDPKNSPSCSNIGECASTCFEVPDSGQCGKPFSGQIHKECRNSACVNVLGSGANLCENDTQCTSGGGGDNGGGGAGEEYYFILPNPIGIDSFQDLVNVIGRWIFNLSIPIAVIMIVYAGILMLTAGNNPGRYKNGLNALKYAVIGLAIVFIGKGFVTLIQSILNLRS